MSQKPQQTWPHLELHAPTERWIDLAFSFRRQDEILNERQDLWTHRYIELGQLGYFDREAEAARAIWDATRPPPAKSRNRRRSAVLGLAGASSHL